MRFNVVLKLLHSCCVRITVITRWQLWDSELFTSSDSEIIHFYGNSYNGKTDVCVALFLMTSNGNHYINSLLKTLKNKQSASNTIDERIQRSHSSIKTYFFINWNLIMMEFLTLGTKCVIWLVSDVITYPDNRKQQLKRLYPQYTHNIIQYMSELAFMYNMLYVIRMACRLYCMWSITCMCKESDSRWYTPGQLSK